MQNARLVSIRRPAIMKYWNLQQPGSKYVLWTVKRLRDFWAGLTAKKKLISYI